jgi:hypothetical protein
MVRKPLRLSSLLLVAVVAVQQDLTTAQSQ